LGSDEISSSSWNLYSGNVYYASFSRINSRCGYLTDCFEDRSIWLMPESSIAAVDSPGEVYYDDGAGRVYVWSTTGIPSEHQIECSIRTPFGLSSGYTDRPTGYSSPNYVVIQNLTIMHGFNKAISIGGASEYFDIINNEFAFNSGQGSCSENPAAIMHQVDCGTNYDAEHTTLACMAQGINIIGNKIHDQGSDLGPGIYLPAGTDHSGYAIKLYSVRNSIVRDNEMYNVAGGVGIKAKNYNLTISNNSIHDFVASGVYLMVVAANITIEGNRFYDSLSPNRGIAIAWEGDQSVGAPVHTDNVTILQNTFWNIESTGDSMGILMDIVGLSKTHLIRNNIFARVENDMGTRQTSSPPDYTSSHNSFYKISGAPSFIIGYGGTDLAGWQSFTGQENSPILLSGSDALFNDANNGDFTLDSASSLIDAGQWIPGFHCTNPGVEDFPGCRMWYGTAPDIGAFEYVDLSSCTLTYDVEPCDCINDTELQNAVNAWFAGTLSTSELYSHFQVWKTSSGC